jgi:hypothetical protein
MHAPVSDNFDGAIREQHVDEHPVVVLGIPYPQLGKNFNGAVPCGLLMEKRHDVKRALDGKTDFPDMVGVAGFVRLFDRDHGIAWKCPPDPAMRRQQVSYDSMDVHS